MSYQSVDALQKALGESIFNNRQDVKKAAGRALGTIVELITYYIIREWGLVPNLTIERGLAEFANQQVTHNVEFGIHPAYDHGRIKLQRSGPITSQKLIKKILDAGELTEFVSNNETKQKKNVLLTNDDIIRNSCVLIDADDGILIANIADADDLNADIILTVVRPAPFAMIECKRVGVEEGMKKGPTTIEKAKQGAYVAKHVSSLQKIRGRDGKMYGAMPKSDGTFEISILKDELNRLVFEASPEDLEGFILTVGIVSNHGNWFTAENQNKELLVLNQSYDWLLFLTDPAIGEFVEETILSNSEEMRPVRDAFRESYASGESGRNQFTKVKISKKAHEVLCIYFKQRIQRIEETWFNIISPPGETIHDLKVQLKELSRKLGPVN